MPIICAILKWLGWGISGKGGLIIENGRKIKDLGRICRELQVRPERAVMIGDNERGCDQRSAERYGILFIEVPRLDGEFSLLQLLGDV